MYPLTRKYCIIKKDWITSRMEIGDKEKVSYHKRDRSLFQCIVVFYLLRWVQRGKMQTKQIQKSSACLFFSWINDTNRTTNPKGCARVSMKKRPIVSSSKSLDSLNTNTSGGVSSSTHTERNNTRTFSREVEIKITSKIMNVYIKSEEEI